MTVPSMRLCPGAFCSGILSTALVVGGCGASPSASAPASPSASAPAAPVAAGPSEARPATDRELYEVLVRLARDPSAVPELAPEVWSVHFPMDGVDPDDVVARNEAVRELVADPSALLARYGEITFVDRTAPNRDEEDQEPEVACTCDLEHLVCVLHQSGGATEFHFAVRGARIVLTEQHWEYP